MSAESPETKPFDKLAIVSDLNHELRTVLGGVIGINELLLSGDLSAQQRQFSSTIDQSSRALLLVLNDIVEFARLELGKVVPSLAPIDINRVVKDAFDHLEPLLVNRDTQPDRSSETFSQPAFTDAHLLQQIITTLYARILTCCEKTAVRLELMTEEQTPEGFTLRIAASGTVNQFDHIFLSTLNEPMKQGRKHDSRWLSLYLCQRLVQLLGGTCGCDLAGRDCTLWARVPLRALPLPA